MYSYFVRFSYNKNIRNTRTDSGIVQSEILLLNNDDMDYLRILIAESLLNWDKYGNENYSVYVKELSFLGRVGYNIKSTGA